MPVPVLVPYISRFSTLGEQTIFWLLLREATTHLLRKLYGTRCGTVPVPVEPQSLSTVLPVAVEIEDEFRSTGTVTGHCYQVGKVRN
jgi:hypothetical protein